jgi:site-specific recombinase XerD
MAEETGDLSRLFPSRRHHGISRWALDELMKKYCRIAGVAEEKAHMHALKHSSGSTTTLVPVTWPRPRIIWGIATFKTP